MKRSTGYVLIAAALVAYAGIAAYLHRPTAPASAELSACEKPRPANAQDWTYEQQQDAARCMKLRVNTQ